MVQKYNVNDLKHEELASKRTNEKLALSAVISSSFNFKELFVVHEILPPGRKDSSPHSHNKKEEMLFILEGKPILHLGNESIELAPGDYIGLPPSTEPHYLENLSAYPVKFLKICSNPKDDAVNY